MAVPQAWACWLSTDCRCRPAAVAQNHWRGCQDGRGLAAARRNGRAGPGGRAKYCLRAAVRLPAEPYCGQGHGAQNPRALPVSQYRVGGLRPRRVQNQPGKPHQADALSGAVIPALSRREFKLI